ncbi:MAG: hypothetical protein AUK58_03350 [Candidatus Moranbacteria bacterium CG2_30_41_165]|nr:MAG: hypothetical protein AUK58_03350 [Candidatus Moranbacteria bacterium CG2_30_41_165]
MLRKGMLQLRIEFRKRKEKKSRKRLFCIQKASAFVLSLKIEMYYRTFAFIQRIVYTEDIIKTKITRTIFTVVEIKI